MTPGATIQDVQFVGTSGYDLADVDITTSNAGRMATILVTNSVGYSGTYNLSATPTVYADTNGGALSAGSGYAVLIGGNSATLDGGTNVNLMLELGNNGTITGGGGANQILLGGTNGSATSLTGTNTLVVTGSGNTADLGDRHVS